MIQELVGNSRSFGTASLLLITCCLPLADLRENSKHNVIILFISIFLFFIYGPTVFWYVHVLYHCHWLLVFLVFYYYLNLFMVVGNKFSTKPVHKVRFVAINTRAVTSRMSASVLLLLYLHKVFEYLPSFSFDDLIWTLLYVWSLLALGHKSSSSFQFW